MPVLELERGTITTADKNTKRNAPADPRMGANNCSRCNCEAYYRAEYGTDNYNCTCKHSYEEHW